MQNRHVLIAGNGAEGFVLWVAEALLLSCLNTEANSGWNRVYFSTVRAFILA